jgi:hypothetical protein
MFDMRSNFNSMHNFNADISVPLAFLSQISLLATIGFLNVEESVENGMNHHFYTSPEEKSERKITSDMSIYHQKFNELIIESNDIPEDLQDPILFSLMINPYYHPSCPQQNMDFETLSQISKDKKTIQHPQTRAYVPFVEFKLNIPLQQQINFYLFTFKEFYNYIADLSEEKRSKFTSKELPEIVHYRAHFHPVSVLSVELSLSKNPAIFFSRNKTSSSKSIEEKSRKELNAMAPSIQRVSFCQHLGKFAAKVSTTVAKNIGFSIETSRFNF